MGTKSAKPWRAFWPLIALSCLAPVLLPAAASAAQGRQDLSDLRARIEQLRRELADTTESRSEAADALRQSERAISDANRRLRDIAAQQSAIDQRTSELESMGLKIGQQAAQGRMLLRRSLQQRYLRGGHGFLKLLIKGHDPNGIARQSHYLTYIAAAEAEALRRLSGDQKRLTAISTEIEEKKARLSELRTEEQEQKARLEAERKERKTLLSKLSLQLAAQRKEIGKLKRDEERLSRLVEKLAKTLATPGSSPGPRNELLPGAEHEGAPFQQLKGRLHLPVRGEVGNRFGAARSDSGVLWKGLLILAKPGEAVRAVASGRVVFADWLRGFGNLLIVDHGEGYMSLYGYNETLFKQVGEEVQPGDVIASVGSSGGGTETGLYFELRHQGRAFDPLPWTSLK